MVSQRRQIASGCSTSPRRRTSETDRPRQPEHGCAADHSKPRNGTFLPVISNERFLLDMLNPKRYPVRHRAGLTWMGTLDNN